VKSGIVKSKILKSTGTARDHDALTLISRFSIFDARLADVASLGTRFLTADRHASGLRKT
jgi:hypothetical protein